MTDALLCLCHSFMEPKPFSSAQFNAETCGRRYNTHLCEEEETQTRSNNTHPSVGHYLAH